LLHSGGGPVLQVLCNKESKREEGEKEREKEREKEKLKEIRDREIETLISRE